MADRKRKDVCGRQKAEAMLPVTSWSQRYVNFVPARVKIPAEIDDVPFSPGVVPCRRDVQNLHETKFSTSLGERSKAGKKKGTPHKERAVVLGIK
jgi:hypothetical protein